ncbi:MAG: tetratricopeptide repeat protein [Pseudomonadota bacterium]
MTGFAFRRLVAAGGVLFAWSFGGPPVQAAEAAVPPNPVITPCQAITTPAQAITACEAAIASGRWSGKDLAWAWNNLGLAQAAERRFLAAIKAYDEALALDPDYAAALANRGNTHAALGDLIPALADHERVVALTPKDASAWMNRGADHEDMGQYKKALADYNQAIKLDPDHRGAHIGRATANCKLGRSKTSAKHRLAAITKGLIDPTEMQVVLQKEGFYRGKIDGIFGKGSRAALRQWTRKGCLPRA